MISRNSGRDEDSRRERELQQIREALKDLRFGTIDVIVQDGVVIQIERTDRYRVQRNAESPRPPRGRD